jgi:hypothetical protein
MVSFGDQRRPAVAGEDIACAPDDLQHRLFVCFPFLVPGSFPAAEKRIDEDGGLDEADLPTGVAEPF